MLYLFVSKMIKVHIHKSWLIVFTFFSPGFDSLLLQVPTWWFVSHHLILGLTPVFIICFSPSSLRTHSAFPFTLPSC